VDQWSELLCLSWLGLSLRLRGENWEETRANAVFTAPIPPPHVLYVCQSVSLYMYTVRCFQKHIYSICTRITASNQQRKRFGPPTEAQTHCSSCSFYYFSARLANRRSTAMV
jgi:hypothetical protein